MRFLISIFRSGGSRNKETLSQIFNWKVGLEIMLFEFEKSHISLSIFRSEGGRKIKIKSHILN